MTTNSKHYVWCRIKVPAKSLDAENLKVCECEALKKRNKELGKALRGTRNLLMAWQPDEINSMHRSFGKEIAKINNALTIPTEGKVCGCLVTGDENCNFCTNPIKEV